MLSFRIPETVVPGRRLGRHVQHDPRSLRYLVAPRAHAARSVTWARTSPVLDQGQLGSCTGNALIGACGTAPLYETMPAGTSLDEPAAIGVYELATQLDDAPGQYPPTDTGSSGLAAAKAAQRLGLISGYRHCTSLDAVITALQDGPVITGVNWYSSFDEPDSGGRVGIGAGATVRGGHEFEVLGVDLEAGMLHAVNSWGPSWGSGGHFYLPLTDYERLLREQGDATVLVPITVPAPVPSPPTPGPTPDPSPFTVRFTSDQHAALTGWASRPHGYHEATIAARAWQAAQLA